MGSAAVLSIPPIDFTFRSPYSFNNTPGLPPAGVVAGGAPLHVNDAGDLTIAGVVLTPYRSNTPGPNQAVLPTFDQGSYGDSQSVVLQFTGVGFAVDAQGNPSPYVLSRPSNQRTQLLIQNNTIGVLYYAFDKHADNVSCIGIAAGGSREFDSRIPQGALSLYALAGGAAVLEFMNNDVT